MKKPPMRPAAIQAQSSDNAVFDLVQVKSRASREFWKYLYSGHGLFLWRAFLEYRHAGLPVAERILAELERQAKALQGKTTAREMLGVLKLVRDNGRARTPDDARKIDHMVLALQEAAEAIKRRDRLKANRAEGLNIGSSAADADETNDEIFRRIAKRYRVPAHTTLKDMFYDWQRTVKKGKKARDARAVSDAAAAWMSPKAPTK